MITLSLCMSSESCIPWGDTCPLSDGGKGRSFGEGESYLYRNWVPIVTFKTADKIQTMTKLCIQIHSLDPHNVSSGLIELLFL